MALDAPDITRGPDITTESAARSLVSRYFLQQNRPYSALQVYENLHRRIAKGMVERVLNTLTESSTGPGMCRLQCKEYGKAKIYFPDQSIFPVLSPPELIALQVLSGGRLRLI